MLKRVGWNIRLIKNNVASEECGTPDTSVMRTNGYMTTTNGNGQLFEYIDDEGIPRGLAEQHTQ